MNSFCDRENEFPIFSVEFYVGKWTIRERTVITDYSFYVENLDFRAQLFLSIKEVLM